MRASFATALCALLTVICNIPAVIAQQFLGERIDTPGGINNTLGSVPGAEITYWNIKDPNKKNATLINYSSLDENWNRLTPSNVQRVVIFVHGLGRDGGTYMSNMLSAMAQIQGRPDVNRSNVQIVCPVFPNGNDKNITYPWTNGLAPGKGSTSSALVWYASGWISGDDAQVCLELLFKTRFSLLINHSTPPTVPVSALSSFLTRWSSTTTTRLCILTSSKSSLLDTLQVPKMFIVTLLSVKCSTQRRL